MAYNRRRASANKSKTPMSVVSITTGIISFLCILVMLACLRFLVVNEVTTDISVLGILVANMIVAVGSLAFSLGELKKQGYDFVTRIVCFIISVIPVVAYVALYVYGFMM